MKFSVAAALTAVMASAVSAMPSNGTVASTTTEVVSVYVTYCPYATTIVNGEHTYTVTEPGTLTMTDGPYTVTKAVYTTSSVICQAGCTTPGVAHPTGGYSNSTANPHPSQPAPTHPGSGATTPSPETPIPTGGAAQMAGAGLAAVLGFAVLAL